jgi:hypothetical protein
MGQDKDGKPLTRATMPPPSPKLAVDSVAKFISDGTYVVTYDGTGLQQAGPGNSNPDSTWYEFTIKNKGGDVVGEYHIHPTGPGGKFFASGNLRIKDSSSFGNYIVGRATDWRPLCDSVKKQL